MRDALQKYRKGHLHGTKILYLGRSSNSFFFSFYNTTATYTTSNTYNTTTYITAILTSRRN